MTKGRPITRLVASNNIKIPKLPIINSIGKLKFSLIEMFKRTQEQKQNLVRELTQAFVKTCGGNKEAIKILITEVNKNNWASGGIISADKEKNI